MHTWFLGLRVAHDATLRRSWSSFGQRTSRYWRAYGDDQRKPSEYALFMLVLTMVWLTCVASFSVLPDVALDQLPGIYLSEDTPTSFRWTGSRAVIPLGERSGTTQVRLTLDRAGLDQSAGGIVTLMTDSGTLGMAVVGSQTRRYDILVPATATYLELLTPVVQPANDWRWLGLRLLGVRTQPSGLPLQAAKQALLVTLASVPVLLVAQWAIRRGYGSLVVITGVGLILRFAKLSFAPALLHRDEAVKLVDAWFLSQTGRDHLGARFPMVTFEAYGDWVSPLLTYLQVPFVALVGPEPLVARAVTASVGTLAIPLAYALARSLRLPLVAAYCAALVTALSPWQIFLSRVAMEVALVPAFWTLSLWAAVQLVQNGRRRDALTLALAAGVTLYVYPTMKLAVPVLVALAVLLGSLRFGRRIAAAWTLPTFLLVLLASPLAISTLFNRASNNRLNQVRLRADTWSDWLVLWWQNYAVYWQPNFYYLKGGLRKDIQGVPGHGMALGAEAPLLLLGAGVLLVYLFGGRRLFAMCAAGAPAQAGRTKLVWWLVLAMVLLAPLPASLTRDNPNVYRASAIAPVYVLLVALGAAAAWTLIALRFRAPWHTVVRWVCVVTCCLALVWQNTRWYAALTGWYPRVVGATWFYADTQVDAMKRVVEVAPAYDEVWLDPSTLGRPEIYLMLAQPMEPKDVLQHIEIERKPGGSTIVKAFSPYTFTDLSHIPRDLPVVDVKLNRWGSGGYILQHLQDGDQAVLVVRGLHHQFAEPPPRW